mmetsp:Transcript_21043/g.68100  ORF Transcript_21043/g.68100 Transcript_21043/m.68100 type:complete len:211 (+) Transcript_21043:913-1545(+)
MKYTSSKSVTITVSQMNTDTRKHAEHWFPRSKKLFPWPPRLVVFTPPLAKHVSGHRLGMLVSTAMGIRVETSHRPVVQRINTQTKVLRKRFLMPFQRRLAREAMLEVRSAAFSALIDLRTPRSTSLSRFDFIELNICAIVTWSCFVSGAPSGSMRFMVISLKRETYRMRNEIRATKYTHARSWFRSFETALQKNIAAIAHKRPMPDVLSA